VAVAPGSGLAVASPPVWEERRPSVGRLLRIMRVISLPVAWPDLEGAVGRCHARATPGTLTVNERPKAGGCSPGLEAALAAPHIECEREGHPPGRGPPCACPRLFPAAV
jgi:hypothetical protein